MFYLINGVSMGRSAKCQIAFAVTHFFFILDALMVRKVYACSKCPNRIYKHRAYLTRHERYECGNQRHFQCEFCLVRYNRKYTLKNHLRRCSKKSIKKGRKK